MKGLTLIFTLGLLAITSVMWFVGVTSVLMDIPWVRVIGPDFIFWLAVPQLYERPFLQALALMGIASLYNHIVQLCSL